MGRIVTEQPPRIARRITTENFGANVEEILTRCKLEDLSRIVLTPAEKASVIIKRMKLT